jgi:hypothetical protein
MTETIQTIAQTQNKSMPMSAREQLLRVVNIDRFRTLTLEGVLRTINSTVEIATQNKGEVAWVTDIHIVIRDAEGKNILEADKRGEIPLDDIRVFINIDNTDFTDRPTPIQALSTKDDNKDLHSGFRIPAFARMLFRFESKQLADGVVNCKYPLKIDATLKYYELNTR